MSLSTGDVIRFKTWEQLRKEYGPIDSAGDIHIKNGIYFAKGMEYLCGTQAKIIAVYGETVYLSSRVASGWHIIKEMVELVGTETNKQITKKELEKLM